MKPKRCNGWAWRPPAEPDPGHVLTGAAAHLAARQMQDDQQSTCPISVRLEYPCAHRFELEGPPDEELWAQSLGQRFAELIRDTN